MSTTDTLRVEVAQRDRGAVVTLNGSASMDLCDRLAVALAEACRSKPRVLVIDLERLEFICSLGLGCIVVAYVRVRKYGGKLTLANPVPSIRDMLATTKLTALMPVYDSAEQALSAR